MPNFIDIFRQRGQISFTGMRSVAMSKLPTDKMKLDKLYNDLKRGTGILDDDDHLNMYLRSFGKMHKAKLDIAFNCIHNPSELFGSPVEVYDWGCGQGTATVCLLDFLKSKKIVADIRSINLIEPIMDEYRANYYIISGHTQKHFEGSSRIWYERLKIIALPRDLVTWESD